MSSLKKVILVDVVDPRSPTKDAIKELVELQSLVKTYGGIDIANIIQHRTKPDKNIFIGSGKVEELKEIIRLRKIDIVIINAIVNHGQLFRLTQSFWPANRLIQVWDRIDLILNIFDRHARTAEAKLQIEIARMQHMGPRISGLGSTYFSRQGGGIGGRGIGEKNIELMKRHWKDHIKAKTLTLKKLTDNRQRQLDNRRNSGQKTVSIIGYTNAGKTALFNRLTGKNKIVKDALFVTLDSILGKLYLPQLKQEVMISDTIGFIKNLPPSLIEAFQSTLLESMNADLLLHVVDVADDKMDVKIKVVEELLKELGIANKKQLYVFNKIDALPRNQSESSKLRGLPKNPYLIKKYIADNFQTHNPLFISVKDDLGIELVKDTIAKTFV